MNMTQDQLNAMIAAAVSAALQSQAPSDTASAETKKAIEARVSELRVTAVETGKSLNATFDGFDPFLQKTFIARVGYAAVDEYFKSRVWAERFQLKLDRLDRDTHGASASEEGCDGADGKINSYAQVEQAIRSNMIKAEEAEITIYACEYALERIDSSALSDHELQRFEQWVPEFRYSEEAYLAHVKKDEANNAQSFQTKRQQAVAGTRTLARTERWTAAK